jgi:peptidoglycan/LPS O-acetylase OafA/YrhL
LSKHNGPSADVANSWKLGHRPALDGLRAFAVTAVVGVHVSTVLVPSLNGHWFVGGVLGVNMFFVISGFLITALLLEEHQRSGRISLASFWKRRSLRLFPALYALLIVQFLYTLHVHDPVPYTLKGDGLIVGYVSNWAWVYRWPQPFGTGNTWSLGVEEQFYVVWPVVLAVLLRMRVWLVGPVALAVAIYSVMYRAHLYDTSKDWVRPIADTRVELDALMIGVLLAWGLHLGWRPPRVLSYLLAVPSIWFLQHEIHTYSSVLTLRGHVYIIGHWVLLGVALSTAVLILCALEPRGLFYFILTLPPLRWLGRLSYSLYIWHVLVFSWLARSPDFTAGIVRGIAGITISLGAAVASYYLVERPFVRLAHRRPGRRRAPQHGGRLVGVAPQ